MTSKLDGYLAENKDRYQHELFELLRIPSVSDLSTHKDDVKKAAEWLHDRLTKLGLKSRLVTTGRHPIIVAETAAVPGKPVALVYGHYDVQPVDPLNEWKSPPFEPTVRDGKVFCRGATDDKGQMYTHLCSVDAWLKSHQSLPVQVKFLLEGEEECGSKSINELLEGKYDTADWKALEAIKSDVVVVSDTSQYAPGQPAITTGLRGLAYFQLDVWGPKNDLHSGMFGGAVTNPVIALCHVMSSIWDSKTGKIQIPGYYDDVVPLTKAERDQFASLGFSDAEFMDDLGITGVFGEEGFTTLERKWARPTFDINGIYGGFQGEGGKTIIPAKASAKFSFRLVPNQDPQKITAGLKTLLAEKMPVGVQYKLHEMGSGPGVLVDGTSPYVAAASAAIKQSFGTAPVLIREGGSIPIVTAFKTKLKVDTLLLGWGQDDDNLHAPNEKFSLDDFQKGIRASAYLWSELANLK